ncbi:phosphate acyltransferase PlsX [Roseicitreum antarcticum]|uniref:Phosphate acyltransferase n=1 Tax=Roseicitreum antarcticum TaxID=564137 RepID=A0A1H3D9Q4_9RHOB|nr:phosphate acyltransferase PlsX [Roseicitreum antarcticum]SDX63242.1 phosphate:acyl-[acyl carrier protein] acyltransferase [Roseicitreum antarcticum]
MTQHSESRAPTENRVTLSVDAMGGDSGPAAVVEGCAKSAEKNAEIAFILHGDEGVLHGLVAQYPGLTGRCTIRNASGVVTMHEKPSAVLRNGKDTSMWSCIEAVRAGEATVAVSCGNTGALMAVSMIRLRKLPGVARPAIACLWPSRGRHGFSTMLDVGADVKADPDDLLQYALMGAAYFRNGFGEQRPRVGLLNVGTEENKGRTEYKAAYDLIEAAAELGRYEFVGFVEGGDIPTDRVDVVVTDGFTGNIALKTGEGTASLIRDFLREELKRGWLSQLGALLAMQALKRLQKRIDPRRVNGGVFLGLNGTVVKSHGSADATGVSAAIKLAFQLAQSGFTERMAHRLASVAEGRAQAAAEAAQTKPEGQTAP